MGAEVSKDQTSSICRSRSSSASTFPNNFVDETDLVPWTLLHQTTLDKWLACDAVAAGFQEKEMTCSGILGKDCSAAFCINRQGIMNLSKTSSFFSFRKRSKFSKMAEHFEYNHIPAMLSSIHNYRVRGILCYNDSLVVLHFVKNKFRPMFGQLDLERNKFLGVFGDEKEKLADGEVIQGEISPDKSLCMVCSSDSGSSLYQLYDLRTNALQGQVLINSAPTNFAFDPRFKCSRFAATNFARDRLNCLSLLQTNGFELLKNNERMCDTRSSLYPFLKSLKYSRSGHLLLASIHDHTCNCHVKRTLSQLSCSVYIYSSDTADTLHCIQFNRLTCTRHLCPVNYLPIVSLCSSRIALLMNDFREINQDFIQVYQLPTPVDLQSMCRIKILQHYPWEWLKRVPLPTSLIYYLQFKPELE